MSLYKQIPKISWINFNFYKNIPKILIPELIPKYSHVLNRPFSIKYQ